jgi:5-methylcytosine-specific restriction endonuclease McrA
MNNNLNKKVLLLNQSYQPLMTVGVKRAIILSFTDKVEVLERYVEQIHSVSLSIFIPSVLRLKDYVKFNKKRISLTRKNILKRDGHLCQYCNSKPNFITVDHIVPKHKGGGDSWENLVAACIPCNTKKGNKLLKDINMELSRKPKIPSILFNLQNDLSNKQNSWKPYLFMKEKN